MNRKFSDFDTESVGSLSPLDEEANRKASLFVCTYACEQEDASSVAEELLSMLGLLGDRPLRSTLRYEKKVKP